MCNESFVCFNDPSTLQGDLASVGFVAEHEQDAVEKWLEEEYMGPVVVEPSWKDFGKALITPQAPLVLLKACVWDVLHPDGWVRPMCLCNSYTAA
jgi:hypothetical protein